MAWLDQDIRPVTSTAVLKAMHDDYLAVRARSRDPQTGTEEAHWCERASELVLSLVSLVPQARATDTPLDLSFAIAVDSIEDAITAEAMSDNGHGRRAVHLLREYLSQVPGYLSPQVREGAPVAAEALAFHGNVVSLVTALRSHHAEMAEMKCSPATANAPGFRSGSNDAAGAAGIAKNAVPVGIDLDAVYIQFLLGKP